MEPISRKKNDPSTRSLLLSTGAILIGAFLVVIALFFVFSAFTPAITGKCVAVVNLDQEITLDGSPSGLLSAGTPSSGQIASSIRALNKRDDVGSVLLVVNSPGGSVVATHDIYNAVDQLNKPSVAYFREVAASGAYYISSRTNYIVSDPDTLTGSIGVVTTVSDLSGLMGKLGVNVTAITSGQYKDMGSSFRDMTPSERSILQNISDSVYLEFRSRVIKNRGSRLNLPLFYSVSDGRIMTGTQAYEVGLVDKLGMQDDALMKAAALGNISAATSEDVHVCPISLESGGTGLFNLASILKGFQLSGHPPALQFK